jgi:carbonic anhydrase
MDCRIDPVPALGLAPGDAVILRNAGAEVSDDVLRSLRLARHNLGVSAVRVVGHTDCAAHGSDDEVAAAEVERGVVRIGVVLPGLEARGAMLDLRSGAVVSV